MAVSYAGVDRRQSRAPEQEAQAAALVSIGDRSLAGEVGAEVAGALHQALAQLDAMLAQGRAARPDLHAVRGGVERARRIAMLGQQVSRLAAGLARPTPEPLELPELLHAAVQQMGDEIIGRGLTIRQRLRPAHLTADPCLVHSLLDCLLHWALEHSHGPTLTLATEMSTWPVHAVLSCEFAIAPPDDPDANAALSGAGQSRLDTLPWRLVEQAAAVLGVQLMREESAEEVQVTLAFSESSRRWPKLVDDAMTLIDPGPGPGTGSALSLGGCEVLLVSDRTELQRVAQTCLVPLGAMLRVAPSVDEARSWDRSTVQVMVVDAATAGVDALCADWGAGATGPALVRIEEGIAGVKGWFNGRSETLSIGSATALRDLPQALRYAQTFKRRKRA